MGAQELDQLGLFESKDGRRSHHPRGRQPSRSVEQTHLREIAAWAEPCELLRRTSFDLAGDDELPFEDDLKRIDLVAFAEELFPFHVLLFVGAGHERHQGWPIEIGEQRQGTQELDEHSPSSERSTARCPSSSSRRNFSFRAHSLALDPARANRAVREKR